MSTIKADNIATLAGVSTSMANAVNGSAKAWVNFNGSGTVAIRQSYNVSSITDNSNGDYTVNFSTAFADTNYAPIVTVSRGNNENELYPNLAGTSRSPSTGSIRMYLRNPFSSAAEDSDNVNVAIFR